MEFYKLFHWRRDWPELLSMEKVLMSDELRTRCEEKMSRMARQIFDVMLLSKLEFRKGDKNEREWEQHDRRFYKR